MCSVFAKEEKTTANIVKFVVNHLGVSRFELYLKIYWNKHSIWVIEIKSRTLFKEEFENVHDS